VEFVLDEFAGLEAVKAAFTYERGLMFSCSGSQSTLGHPPAKAIHQRPSTLRLESF